MQSLMASSDELDLSAHALRSKSNDVECPGGNRRDSRCVGRGAGGKQTRRMATKPGSHPRYGLSRLASERDQLYSLVLPSPMQKNKLPGPTSMPRTCSDSRIAQQS